MTQKQWSELELIQHFSTLSSSNSPSDRLVKGIGDDCAVLSFDSERDWVITTDMLVDSIHFDTAWHPPFELGRKCIAVNLSDIAAMGGIPHMALLSIALPHHFEKRWIDEWSRGMASMLDEFNLRLVGGDTVCGPVFSVSLTIFGTVEKGAAILRAGAGSGDSVWVTGPLGSAAVGLKYFQNQAVKHLSDQQIFSPFIKQHLDPYPDINCGLVLAESGLVTAMQDISDGLATDLAHICQQSNVAAIVEVDALPHDESFYEACALLGENPIEQIISGGDDYHLLFTVRKDDEALLEQIFRDREELKIFPIGTIVPGSGVRLASDGREMDISYRGFEHRGG